MIRQFYFCFLLLSFCSLRAGATDSISDSLEKRLQEKTLADTNRLKILYKLSREYTFNAPEKALVSIDETIKLAQKLKDQK